VPEFTHIVVTSSSDPKVQEAYEFGQAHPLNETWACGPYPYPLLSELREALDAGKKLLMTYADGALRHFIVFDAEGVTSHAAVWPFGDGVTPVPEGMAMITAAYDIIKAQAGKAVTEDKVTEHAALYSELGVETR
jgi:hypothetical protein